MKPQSNLYKRFLGAAGVVGISLFFLVFSCTQKLPTIPSVPDQTAASAPGGPQTSLPLIGESLLGTVGKLIGPPGGTLLIPIENTTDTSLLIVPKWSLRKDVYITVSARFDQNENATFYECGPDGLRFSKPAQLLHRAREPDGTVLNLWYFDSDHRRWEKYGSARVIAGTAIFPISHFSKWAIAPEWDALSSGGQ